MLYRFLGSRHIRTFPSFFAPPPPYWIPTFVDSVTKGIISWLTINSSSVCCNVTGILHGFCTVGGMNPWVTVYWETLTKGKFDKFDKPGSDRQTTTAQN